MKNRFIRKLIKLWKKPLVKVIIYILALIFILIFSKMFTEQETESINLFDRFVEVVTSEDTISFFTAGILAIILVTIVTASEKRMEEILKIESNHHKIINQYSGHECNKLSEDNTNYYNPDGIIMELHHVKVKKNIAENYVRDKYSVEYDKVQREIQFLYYDKKVVLLPSTNVFVNREGNIKVNFVDRYNFKKLPEFVINSGIQFLGAHKYSNIKNSVTIRLDDIAYNNNELQLHTSRTWYYHMLLTNRCMDYKIGNGITIRSLYEFNKKITPLKESKLSNQIGINGMIITNDGYLLLEKRSRKKTTWKNKFAQPISLAFKENDLVLNENNEIDMSTEAANNNLFKVIKNTLKSNFGITEDVIKEFSLSNNFLGVARDLLEGGKPNLYFFVEIDKSAEELALQIKQYSGKISAADGSRKGVISKSKLDSQYYFIKYEDILVDYNYTLKVKKSKVKRVKRIVYPRSRRIRCIFSDLNYNLQKIFIRNLNYECGEALLVTLSYLELCQHRIEYIKDSKEVL